MNIALPSAQAELGFSDADRQWVITAYTLAFGGLLLLGGRLADLVGRRRAFLVGLLGFAAASAAGGAATGLPMLIAARATQGACAALLAPTVLSTLAVTFSEVGERAKAFAIFGAIAGGGGALGLVLGGLLTDSLGWRWCLYVNVPIAVLAATGGWLLLTDARGARHRRLDAPGALLVTSAMVAVVYGCTRATFNGWGSPWTVGLFAAAALLLALFVLRESRVDSPLLPLHILRDRNRAGAYLSVASAVAGLSRTSSSPTRKDASCSSKSGVVGFPARWRRETPSGPSWDDGSGAYGSRFYSPSSRWCRASWSPQTTPLAAPSNTACGAG
jgi:MFS family permease